MYCIASEVSVKVHVLFEQYNRNAFTRQEQGKDGTGRAAPYDTAGCLFYLPLCVLFFVGIRNDFFHILPPVY
jgi:hypothetical protein